MLSLWHIIYKNWHILYILAFKESTNAWYGSVNDWYSCMELKLEVPFILYVLRLLFVTHRKNTEYEISAYTLVICRTWPTVLRMLQVLTDSSAWVKDRMSNSIQGSIIRGKEDTFEKWLYKWWGCCGGLKFKQWLLWTLILNWILIEH